jgi:hypothetical protein
MTVLRISLIIKIDYIVCYFYFVLILSILLCLFTMFCKCFYVGIVLLVSFVKTIFSLVC